MTSGVRYEVDGRSEGAGVATITLDRPEQRNRLDAAGMSGLLEGLRAAADDPQVRVVVLTGAGPAFCAGADLSGATAGGAFSDEGPRALERVLMEMLEMPKPIVARVQGHVAGGGNGLVAAADLAVASQDARFAFSEVRVGVAPAVISVVCLRVMHPRDAQELMLSGERVSAERARQAGLITSVVPPEQLDDAVAEYVTALLAGGPEAVARTKGLLLRIPNLSLSDAFDEATALSSSLFASEEAREGMTAFLEKRAPAWAPAQAEG